jgi:hypothetical protein
MAADDKKTGLKEDVAKVASDISEDTKAAVAKFIPELAQLEQELAVHGHSLASAIRELAQRVLGVVHADVRKQEESK